MNRTTSKTLYWLVQIAGIVTVVSVVTTSIEDASHYAGGFLARPEIWAIGLPVGVLLLLFARSLRKKFADSDPVPSRARIVVVSLLQGIVGVPFLGRFVADMQHGQGMSSKAFAMTVQIGILTSLVLIAMRLSKRQNALAGARNDLAAGDEGQDAA